MTEKNLLSFLNSTECFCPYTNLTKHISRAKEAKHCLSPGNVRAYLLLGEIEEFLTKIQEIVSKG